MDALVYHPDTEYKLTLNGYNAMIKKNPKTIEIHEQTITLLDMGTFNDRIKYSQNNGIVKRHGVYLFSINLATNEFKLVGSFDKNSCSIMKVRESEINVLALKIECLQAQVEEYKKECVELRELVASFREFSEGFDRAVGK